MGYLIYSLWSLNSSSICKVPHSFRSEKVSLIMSSAVIFFWNFWYTEFQLSQLYLSFIFLISLSLRESRCQFIYIFKLINPILFSCKMMSFCDQLYTHHGKFFESPHLISQTQKQGTVERWHISAQLRGTAKSGKGFKGNWESFEGATQWKRALSKTNVKFPLICDK